MNPEQERAASFFRKYGMDYADIDMGSMAGLFLEEMGRGLKGEPSSLAMIPTYIEIPDDIPSGEPVVVIDAGGTNCRVALVRFTGDKTPVIEKRKRFPMPGLEKEVSAREFYDAFAGCLDEVRDSSDRIGFCFSYPSEMLPTKDGRILYFSKEIKAHEALGGLVGEGLLGALAARGAPGKKRVVVLNDTVATLLAGTSLMGGRNYDGYLGFILGTGTNIAYVEKNKGIEKALGLDPAGSQIVNVEAGNFSLAPLGEIDRRLDRETNNPGRHTFEKMYAGAYFGPLCLLVVKTACADGFFSHEAAARIGGLRGLDTKEVSDFLAAPETAPPLSGIVASEADRSALYALLDRLVERSAVLAAAALSAAVLRSGRGADPARPACVSAEGSTFFGLKGLTSRTERYLASYLTDVRRAHCEIVSVDHATLVGAAVAGLTN
ncbi:MAG: hexokinase [Spirochaetales bacterium]|nr:hexokinase [Spirochaetales bacterium]